MRFASPTLFRRFRSDAIRAMLFVAIIVSLADSPLHAGLLSHQRSVWVLLKDKGIAPSDFVRGNALFDSLRGTFAPSAIERRRAIFGIGRELTIEDAPIAASYVSKLRNAGARIIGQSRWTNSVSIEISDSNLNSILALPFVSGIQPIAHAAAPASTSDIASCVLIATNNNTRTRIEALAGPGLSDSVIYHYGFAQSQLDRIHVPPLHAMGIDATGVTMGWLDTGARWKVVPSLKTRAILGEFDFVFGDSDVANDSTVDDPGQDHHGTGTLGTAIGYEPDVAIGPAYNASVWIAKTEDLRSETPREEENYANALLWMEARGVQITSSSVGYFGFDSGFVSHVYADMNGQTTIAARAAAHAAKLGLLVVTAAGNSGSGAASDLLTPGDADSILTCGAMDTTGLIAKFSSNGPTSDGRIKPEICAPGVFVYAPTPEGYWVPSNGTSFATPLTSSACALIREAHPEASSQAIRKAVMMTGNRADTPGNVYGHGMLNAFGAALQLGTIIGPPRIWTSPFPIVSVGIAANNGIKSAEVRYSLSDTGALDNVIALSKGIDSNIYLGVFPTLPQGSHVRYEVVARDGADTTTTLPRDPMAKRFTFQFGTASVATPRVEDGFFLGPNPATREILVRQPDAQSMTIQIYDALGRLVIEQKESSVAGERLDVSRLAQGSYTVLALIQHSDLHQSVVRKSLSIIR